MRKWFHTSNKQNNNNAATKHYRHENQSLSNVDVIRAKFQKSTMMLIIIAMIGMCCLFIVSVNLKVLERDGIHGFVQGLRKRSALDKRLTLFQQSGIIMPKSPLDDKYITIYLQQIQKWWGGDRDKVINFLTDAKHAGFNSIMVDFPWAFTERSGQGVFSFDSYEKVSHFPSLFV